MNNLEAKMNSVCWSLRIGLGAAAFLAGLDKFFNLLADWKTYISPIARRCCRSAMRLSCMGWGH